MKFGSKSHIHGVGWKQITKLFNYMKWGWDLKEVIKIIPNAGF